MTEISVADEVTRGRDVVANMLHTHEDELAGRSAPQPPALTWDEAMGEVVHVLMRRNGRHQKLLAAYMNVTQSTVSNKLRGTRPWTVNDAAKAAEFLGVELSDLMSEVERARRDSNPKPSDP